MSKISDHLISFLKSDFSLLYERVLQSKTQLRENLTLSIEEIKSLSTKTDSPYIRGRVELTFESILRESSSVFFGIEKALEQFIESAMIKVKSEAHKVAKSRTLVENYRKVLKEKDDIIQDSQAKLYEKIKSEFKAQQLNRKLELELDNLKAKMEKSGKEKISPSIEGSMPIPEMFESALRVKLEKKKEKIALLRENSRKLEEAGKQANLDLASKELELARVKTQVSQQEVELENMLGVIRSMEEKLSEIKSKKATLKDKLRRAESQSSHSRIAAL